MKPKYGNKECLAFNMSFMSRVEREHAYWLESELQAGRIQNWHHEKSYDLLAYNPFIGTTKIGGHKPDFTVFYPGDRIEVHEIKGGNATKTEAWALRRRIFKANYPHIEYRVFDRIANEKKKRLKSWCKKAKKWKTIKMD